MAILGIDWGERRIGLAVSDPDDIIATPLTTLSSAGRQKDIEAIRDIVRERQIQAIVVGLPIHMDGRRGEAAEAALKFANDLAEQLRLPVETLDERWTTAEASRALNEAGRSGRKKRRQVIDAMAAAILLRTYLELRTTRKQESAT